MLQTVAAVGFAVTLGAAVFLLLSIAHTLVRLVWFPDPGAASTLVRTPAGHLRRCTACDSVNEPHYRYCRQCTRAL